jgi:prepilin-type N-terminal cleavage/methylation domain-containing protein
MKSYQRQYSHKQVDQAGFTIIESLVALVVVAILLAAIAPVLVLSTATRVQARRIELATQASKAFVNAIQAKTINDPIIDSTIKLNVANATNKRTVKDNSDKYLLNSVVVPDSSTKNTLYCFNKDGKVQNPGCTSDLFYIQAIRLAVDPNDPDKGQGYRIAIRVYRSDAEFGSLTKTADNSGQSKTQSTFTGGLGSKRLPLVEMTTEIVRGQPSYAALCDRLGGCDRK